MCSSHTAVDSQTVSVLPDALWVYNGGTHNIVEGHVIQVYCNADDITAPTIRWEKNGTEIFQDPPHIFIRTSDSGTTISSVLTIDPFNSTDDGAYNCIASTGFASASSGLLTLTSKTYMHYRVIPSIYSKNMRPVCFLCNILNMRNMIGRFKIDISYDLHC